VAKRNKKNNNHSTRAFAFVLLLQLQLLFRGAKQSAASGAPLAFFLQGV